MKPYTLLYICSAWIVLISLIAIPREFKTILVILGALGVFLVAYGLHRKWREQLQSLRVREQQGDEGKK